MPAPAKPASVGRAGPAGASGLAGEAPQKLFLVGAELPGTDHAVLTSQLDELTELARTAGGEVVGTEIQRRTTPDPATFYGKGKVEEWKALRGDLQYDMVVSNDELSPRQQRNLEKALDAGVVDRTELILDIFAQHARTREGRIQVEVAQLHHMLPRLVGGRDMSRLGGGIGTRGPGEQKLEIDRRRIRTRLRDLEKELGQVRKQRALHRARRARSTQRTVALVGYTNAGKSSLLNALTQGGVVAEDKLFATLDPTTRAMSLPQGGSCLLTDTVGFIQKLPTELVAAFRATLEEVVEADVLLHVLDISHPAAAQQLATVHSVLNDLEAMGKPAILAANKTDLLDPAVMEEALAALDVAPYLEVVPVSALRGTGLDRLRPAIADVLAEGMHEVDALLPYSEQALLAALHRDGVVHSERYEEGGVRVRASVPPALAARVLLHAAARG
ncbi:MAG TPA: GTPase HflX [Candidatus Dormibacteraeota bacterium]|nr:GTPase HflX [Candidatus Dormibacteraeota bacterium]